MAELFKTANIFGKTDSSFRFLKEAKKRGIKDNFIKQILNFSPAEERNAQILCDHLLEFISNKTQDAAFGFGNPTNTLASLRAEILEVLYSEGKRLNGYIPVVNKIAPKGSQTYEYNVVDKFGQAGLISDRGTEGENVGVNMKRISFPLTESGIDAEITDSQLQAANYTGVPLNSISIKMAVLACIAYIEKVMLVGEPKKGWTGLTNNTSVPASSVTITGEWNQTNAASFVNDLTNIITEMEITSNEVLTLVDASDSPLASGTLCIALPIATYNKYSIRQYDSNGLNQSLPSTLQDYASNNPWTNKTGKKIKFKSMRELAGAGAGTNQDRALFYFDSPQIVHLGIVQMPYLRRTIQQSRSILLPFSAMHGAVQFLHPHLCRIVDFDNAIA